MSDTQLTGWRRDVSIAALPLAAVVAASAIGQLATVPNLAWYAGLAKPAYNPPNWVFGPVWIALYGLMAFGAFRILKLAPSRPRLVALVLFFAQLALNAAWPWMFFAMHSPYFGLVNIVPQFLVVMATFVLFAKLDRLAGWSLAPLAAWISYAALLNDAIWKMNG